MCGQISATTTGTPSPPLTSRWSARDASSHCIEMEIDVKISHAVVAALLLSPALARAEVVRYPIPNSSFPIAQAVKVTGSAETYYVSGQVPPLINKDADSASPQAYGDVKTQTVGVLGKVKGILEGLGLGIGDVVKMQ